MRIAIRSYGQGDHINGFGGGEQRWTANVAHFLRTEGYQVVRCAEGRDEGCDLFLDAGFENRACYRIKAPLHVHFRYFGAWQPDHSSSECVESGKCISAAPNKETYLNMLPGNRFTQSFWVEKGYADKVVSLFLPQPYPDDLLPSHINVPGFDRNEIFWGTKDMFHPVFGQAWQEGDQHGWKIVNHGLCTLKALLRLQNERGAEFKMNFLMAHHLREAPAFLGVAELINSFRHKEFRNITPWTDLVSIMARCKLNTPIGGLWGSTPEAIFTGTLPVQFPNNQFYADYSLLPPPENIDEHNLYEILERLWFDREFYHQHLNELSERFQDHRTAGLQRNFQEAFAKIGVV